METDKSLETRSDCFRKHVSLFFLAGRKGSSSWYSISLPACRSFTQWGPRSR
ncbi:rCG62189 [Rattus norvegicus]|uniref:RCG62189 n=1 Tax=Rattus norvegicus TaxID=10116 RepID=A6HBI7_RAT|nr:rCG62189 [Rattus norvegicus]